MVDVRTALMLPRSICREKKARARVEMRIKSIL
jgi:hypothetical protein